MSRKQRRFAGTKGMRRPELGALRPSQRATRAPPAEELPDVGISDRDRGAASTMSTESASTAFDGAAGILPMVLTIEQAAKVLGVGRTLMYGLVMNGEVESVTIGRLRRIPSEALSEYVNRLRTNVRRPAAVA